jgi:hypothetical protein
MLQVEVHKNVGHGEEERRASDSNRYFQRLDRDPRGQV